jgi:hypothetical protein
MPREVFRREVEKELTGREEEPAELVYFKVYKPKSRSSSRRSRRRPCAGHGQIARLLPGDDLRRLPGGREPGQRKPGDLAQFHLTLLQILAWRTAAGFPRKSASGGVLRMIHPKATSLRLDPLSYESLRQQILRRDSWRCQSCGTMSNLEVHHREFRSHSGVDSEENVITLCTACHARVHH